MPNDFRPSDSWDRVAAELRAGREAQRKAWGETDNLLLGRYLADDLTPEERRTVEQALKDHPDLQLLTDVVREVMADPEPAILRFPKRRVSGITRGRAILAAACVLLVVGLPVAGLLSLPPLDRTAGPVAFSSSYQTPAPRQVKSVLSPNSSVEPKAVVGEASNSAPDQTRLVAGQLLEAGKRDLADRKYMEAKDSFRKAEVLLSDKRTNAHMREEAFALQNEAAAKAREAENFFRLAMQSADKAVESREYEKAINGYQAALKFQPTDRGATTALERARRLAARSPATGTIRAVSAHAESDALDKATAALRTFTPAAGQVTEALRRFSELEQPQEK